MQFDLISDLHVDERFGRSMKSMKSIDSYFSDKFRNKNSDVLAIAGDFGFGPPQTKFVLNIASQYYEHVVFVDGNHDHYNHEGLGIEANIYDFRKFSEQRSDLTYLSHHLEGSVKVFENTMFVGDNAWYDWNFHSYLTKEQQFDIWRNYMNDYRMIYFVNDDYPDVYAKNAADYLINTISKADAMTEIDNVVVITHSCPIKEAMWPENKRGSEMNGSFLNSHLKSYIDSGKVSSKVKVWCFGHTHTKFDGVCSNIRFVNNASGYTFEGLSDDIVTIRI